MTQCVQTPKEQQETMSQSVYCLTLQPLKHCLRRVAESFSVKNATLGGSNQAKMLDSSLHHIYIPRSWPSRADTVGASTQAQGKTYLATQGHLDLESDNTKDHAGMLATMLSMLRAGSGSKEPTSKPWGTWTQGRVLGPSLDRKPRFGDSCGLFRTGAVERPRHTAPRAVRVWCL